MVAAAGTGRLFSLHAAISCLVVGLLALLLVVALADHTFFLPQAGLVKSPEVLADRAEQIMKHLGYDPAGKERSQGFAIEPQYLQLPASICGLPTSGIMPEVNDGCCLPCWANHPRRRLCRCVRARFTCDWMARGD